MQNSMIERKTSLKGSGKDDCRLKKMRMLLLNNQQDIRIEDPTRRSVKKGVLESNEVALFCRKISVISDRSPPLHPTSSSHIGPRSTNLTLLLCTSPSNLLLPTPQRREILIIFLRTSLNLPALLSLRRHFLGRQGKRDDLCLDRSFRPLWIVLRGGEFTVEIPEAVADFGAAWRDGCGGGDSSPWA